MCVRGVSRLCQGCRVCISRVTGVCEGGVKAVCIRGVTGVCRTSLSFKPKNTGV